ncbi:MAG: acyltransferase [Candidatus Paceibacterota bacterium]
MKTYFKNLDALRFLAFLSVFISHSALFLGYESKSGSFEHFKNIFLVHGDLGVSFFFVLSGFLISFLLFTEKAKNGSISIRHFYIRRILRIWPVYFLTLIVGFFIIYPIFSKSGIRFPFGIEVDFKSIPWFLFFGVNLKMAFYGLGSAILVVLWSVSMEEQFYLIWPLVLSFVSKKNLLKIVFIIISLSFIYRFVYYNDYNIIKYSTFSLISDLLIGATIAYFSFFSNNFRSFFEKIPKAWIIVIYIIGLSLPILRNFLGDVSSGFLYRFIYSLEPIIFSSFFAFVILEQNIAKNSFVKFGNFKIFNYLGVRSYGLYCYHMVSIFCTFYVFYLLGMPENNHNFILYLLEIVTAFLLAILFSSISYTFMEKKFLSLKEKFGYNS